MTNDKATRRAIESALRAARSDDSIQNIAEAILKGLSELQPVNPDKIAKDAIAFTLRFIENSLCDQMSNGIFNDFKNQQL